MSWTNEKAGSTVGRWLGRVSWLVGGVVVLYLLLMDPWDLHPVDGWLQELLGYQVKGETKVAAEESAARFTCPLHPDVLEEEPGECARCGVDLVPLKDKAQIDPILAHEDEAEGPRRGPGTREPFTPRKDTYLDALSYIDVGAILEEMDGWTVCERPEKLALVGSPGPPEPRRIEAPDGSVLFLTVATGHVESINTLSLSVDGRYLISGSADNTAIVWNARTLEQLLTLHGHLGPVSAVALSHNGGLALTGGADGITRLWDTDSGRALDETERLDGRGNREIVTVTTVAFSADDNQRLVGYDDCKVSLFRKKEISWECPQDPSTPIPAVLSADGGLLLTGGPVNTIQVWDVDSGKIESILEGQEDRVAAAAISADGTRAATTGADGSLVWWDTKSGRQIRSFELGGAGIAVAISPDAGSVAVVNGGPDGLRRLRVWETNGWTPKPRWVRDDLDPASLAFSTDPSSPGIFIGSRTGAVHRIDSVDGKVIRSVEPLRIGVRDVSVSDDGSNIVTAHDDGSVNVWSTRDGPPVRRFETGGLPVCTAGLTRDRKLLLAASKDEIRLWDLEHRGEATEFRWDEQRLSKHWSALPPRELLSLDTRYVLINNGDVLELWDGTTDELLRVFELDSEILSATAFSIGGGDRASSLAAATDTGLLLFDVESGRLERRPHGASETITALAFSADGRRLLEATADGVVRVWGPGGTLEIEIEEAHYGPVKALAWSSLGDRFGTGGDDGVARVWDAGTGEPVHSFDDHEKTVLSLAFSRDGLRLAYGGEKGTLYVHQLIEPAEPKAPKKFSFGESIAAVMFSPASKAVGVRVGDFWEFHHLDLNCPREPDEKFLVHRYQPKSRAERCAAAAVTDAVGRIALVRTGGGAALLDIETDEILMAYRLSDFDGLPSSLALTTDPGQEFVLIGTTSKGLHLFDRRSGRLLQRYWQHDEVEEVLVSPDQRFVVSRDLLDRPNYPLAPYDGNDIELWNRLSGESLRTFVHGGRDRNSPSPGILSVAYSPTENVILTGGEDGTARVWDANTGEDLQRLKGHVGDIGGVTFTPDGRLALSGSQEGMTRLWDPDSGNELGSVIAFPDDTWGVSGPGALYDAANAGDIDRMYWVFKKEVIALSQLKARYYEPGLLGKLLGVNPEPMRDVTAFAVPKLFPSVQAKLEKDPEGIRNLHMTLSNRGGGIGRITLHMNGREIVEDARPSQFDDSAESLELTVDLSPFQHLLLAESSLGSDERNVVSVRVANAEGYLQSRPFELAYPTPGSRRGVGPLAPEPIRKPVVPSFWAIVAGVSDYAGDGIDLRYARKDAADIAKALQLGAEELFDADRVHVTLLTSPEPPTASTEWTVLSPSKQGFEQAFSKVRDAKPEDVLVVYLAGHGVAVGDTYHYLTRDARAADLSDPGVRARGAVSSEEIVAWLKESPALKQVMVLDTCAAGSATAKLMEQRFVPSDQIRAIERMQDRTGFHVLMGSAADAVSYEATRYEQGLLTYSLLQGMKGVALRENRFVDVSTLFQHAADEVPRLASTIGGVQAPIVAAPRGTSFDIGLLDEDSRSEIPLSQPKPMLLPPHLQNVEIGDDLELTKRVRRRLRDRSVALMRGSARSFPAVYVAAEEVPGAIRARGLYSVKNGEVTVRFSLFRDREKLPPEEVEGSTSDLDALTDLIVEAILRAVDSLEATP